MTKPVPFKVRVNVDPPAKTVVGDNEEIEGDGLLIVKFATEEVPPPGAGFTTVTLAVAAAAMSAAVMEAVSCIPETNVVVRLAPFHWMVEFEMKLLPLTVKVKAVPPAVAELGEVELMEGTGFEGGTEVEEFDEPPPQPAVANATRNASASGTGVFMSCPP